MDRVFLPIWGVGVRGVSVAQTWRELLGPALGKRHTANRQTDHLANNHAA
jgi:hypothetical protein